MKEKPSAFRFSVFRTEDEFVAAIKASPFPVRLLHLLLFAIHALVHYFFFFSVAGVMLAIIYCPVAILYYYLHLSGSISVLIGAPIGIFIAYIVVVNLPHLRFFGDDGRNGN